jgi:hypothetical protein
MKSAELAWVLATLATIAGGVLTCQAQEAAPMLASAEYDEELMIWSLGDQVWEFAELATTYLPAKGEFNPQTREAVWTLQIVRDMTPGEVGFQSAMAGSPFKPTFLSADKILLVSDARVKITPITGKLGDAIRVTIQLPEEATLKDVALIRLERRTEIGF